MRRKKLSLPGVGARRAPRAGCRGAGETRAPPRRETVISSFLAAAGVIGVAGFIHGLTGFGFALVATPVLSLLFDAKAAVVLSILLSVPSVVFVALASRRHIDRRWLWRAGACSLLGSPIGVVVLLAVNRSLLRLAIGLGTVAASALILSGYSRPFSNPDRASAAAGFLGGLLTGSTNLGGPPVVLSLVNQGADKDTLRGSVNAFFLLSHLFTFPVLMTTGLITPAILGDFLSLAPASVLTLPLGAWAARRLSAARFRTVVTWVVMGSGLALLLREASRAAALLF